MTKESLIQTPRLAPMSNNRVDMVCSICISPLDEPTPELFDLPSVTSDSRPWPSGRSVRICPCCGVMQRATRPYADFSTVYEDYEMFSLADGSDQVNFSGRPGGRTDKILRFVADMVNDYPQSILDFGSGSGAGLRALSMQYPQAGVYGYEPNGEIKNIPGNVTILPERPTERKFDLVTLFHVLEHVNDPIDAMDYIASILAPNGRVVIQVPYAIMGAFDLVIADHIWHFTMKSLLLVINNAGLAAVYIGNDIITKELTVVAMRGDLARQRQVHFNETAHCRDAIEELVRYNAFLEGVQQQIAVYGTGPAAAWVYAVLGDRVQYFIEDDGARVGKEFQGRKIKSPAACRLPVIAPFPDYHLHEIISRNPDMKFLKP